MFLGIPYRFCIFDIRLTLFQDVESIGKLIYHTCLLVFFAAFLECMSRLISPNGYFLSGSFANIK